MPTNRDYRASKRSLLANSASAQPRSPIEKPSIEKAVSASSTPASTIGVAPSPPDVSLSASASLRNSNKKIAPIAVRSVSAPAPASDPRSSFQLAPLEQLAPLSGVAARGAKPSLLSRLSPSLLARRTRYKTSPRQVCNQPGSRFGGGVLSWQTSGGVRRFRVNAASHRLIFGACCSLFAVLFVFSGFLLYRQHQLATEYRRLVDSAALLRQAHSVLVDGSDNIFSDDYSGLNPDASAKSLGLRSESETQAFSVLALSRKMLSLLEPRSGSSQVGDEDASPSDIELLRDRASIERDLRRARRALRASNHRNGTLSLETADLQKKYERLERDLKAHRKDLRFQQTALSEASRRTRAAEDRLSHIETSAFSLLSDLRDVLGAEEIISSSQDPMLAIRDLAETFANKSDDRRAKLLAYSEYLDYAISGLERTVFSVGIEPSFLEGLGYDISSSVASLSGSSSSFSDDTDLVSIGIGGPLGEDDKSDTSPHTSYKQTFSDLDSRFERFNSLRRLVSCMPLGHPLRGGGRLVSGYGPRLDPFTKEPAVHYGIDFGSWYDTDVYSGGKGRVTYTGYKSSYGRIVEVSHGCGFQTRYAHLGSISVKVGDEIDFDSVLGKVGNTGRSTGPHLHYEVRLRNSPFDPQPFLRGVRNVF